ncbi:MAG TPA: hypothetical protein VK574_07245 [Terracidiphilus sp.]|nr:hypothetical protein [Terracidiphilus sp.]
MRRLLSFLGGRMFLLMILGFPQLMLSQQSVLQFNVPYQCPDGATYVIHKCEKGPKFEACFYQRNQDSERYNTRSQVENQFRTCTVIGKPSPASPAGAQQSSGLQINTPYQCAGGLVLTLFQCQKENGQDYCFVKVEQNGKFLMQVPKLRSEAEQQLKSCQAGATLNPPYLSEFPNVNRVIQGMMAGSPSETVPRSIGALYQLSEVIQTLAQQRGGGLLPDEKKLLDTYSKATSNLITAGAKELPGQKLDLASNPYHFNRTDPRFGFEGISVWVTFLSPTLQSQFAQIVGGNNPTYNAKIAVERQNAMKGLKSDMEAAEAAAKPMPKDAGSVAMRKCMESGRSDMECLGEGMKVGLVDLDGGNPLAGILPEVKPGLRLSGVYAAGTFNVQFDQSSVSVGCGTLIEQPYLYSIERNGTQLAISIPISPRPLVLSFKPDGRLAGPGTIDVAGRVVAGGAVATTNTSYEAQTQTTTQQRQIDANDVANYSADSVHQNGMEYSVDTPVTSTSYNAVPVHHYSVPTAPKTERCNVTTLPPTGSTVKISSALTQLFGTQASKSANTAPGLRLTGTYAQPGGLTIEFRDDSATVECGEAHTAEAYWVAPAGNDFAVKLQNGATPLVLTLQPNGTLAGSGSVEIAGRRIVRSDNNDGVHNFVPVNAHCTVGTLTPHSGS